MRVTSLEMLATLLIVSCGGQTDTSSTALDTGGHTSLSSTGGISSIGGSDSLGQGGSFDVPWKGDAGNHADASTVCAMPDGDFDDTCVTDADCTEVPGGDPCRNTCQCLIGINVRLASKYIADYSAILAKTGQMGFCSCPCLDAVCCRQGRCQNSCGSCN